MSLKQTIQTDFTTAFKAKEEIRKGTLSMLKAEITKAEKTNGKELDDAGVMKVILSCVKQRKQSIEEFTKGGRTDLAEKESGELIVLESYLPKQMSETEAREKILEILKGTNPEDPKPKRIGTVMGTFNKQYTGLFDNKALKSLVEELVGS
jgi:uncharacterized protein YqeY